MTKGLTEEQRRQGLCITWDQGGTEHALSISPDDLSTPFFFTFFSNHDFMALSAYQMFFLSLPLHRKKALGNLRTGQVPEIRLFSSSLSLPISQHCHDLIILFTYCLFILLLREGRDLGPLFSGVFPTPGSTADNDQ